METYENYTIILLYYFNKEWSKNKSIINQLKFSRTVHLCRFSCEKIVLVEWNINVVLYMYVLFYKKQN